MKKLQMLAAGACLAAISAAGAAKELSYRVQVDGKDVPLLSETVTFGSKHPDGKIAFEGPYWFGSFVITGAVTVTVDCTFPLDKVRVLPMSSGIVPSPVSENRIAFKADRPFKISIERHGRHSPLLLFADAPEKGAPAPGTPKVRYFGPGVHAAGRIDLTSGETLYLAAGAVVNGMMAKASAERGDVADAVKDNPALQQMMSRMTLLSLLKQGGADEESVKQLNRILQGIKK